MLPFDLIDLIPENLKRKAIDAVIDFAADKTTNIFGPDFSRKIKTLHSNAEFRIKFEQAIQRAANRFIEEHDGVEKGLMVELIKSENFFVNNQVQQALIAILKQPGLYLEQERYEIIQHFDTVFSGQSDSEQVDKVVSEFLKYLAEEVWNMEEFRGIYSLMFQKLTAEATREQVSLQMAQLDAAIDIRNALLQLTNVIGEQSLLAGNAEISTKLLSRGLEIEHDTSKLKEYHEAYKNNLISDINNNLVLELYDRPQYEDICITPLVYSKNSQDNYMPVEAVKLARLSRSVILGDPGSGKTTALRKLSLDLLYQSPISLVPVFIPLASFSSEYSQGKVSDFLDYINRDISLHGCPNIDVLINATNAEPVLLLDGWDEVTDDDAVKEMKQCLANTRYNFIITSRPEAQRSLPFAERYEMYPLSPNRMEEFIRLRIKDSSIVKRIMSWLLRYPNMMKLAENPLNLSIIIIVFTEEKRKIDYLTRTMLYERAFDAIIRQQHHEHSYDESQIVELELILQKIAYHTMSKGSGRFFSMRELNKSSLEALGRIPSQNLLDLLLGKLGIIRDRRSGRMEFFHLWYQEFLAGRYIVESSPDILDELRNEQLASALPYIVGLLSSSTDAFNLMQAVTIHDPFNFCRAIPEGRFSNIQIETLIKRVLLFGENHKPKIPVRAEIACATAQAGMLAIPSLLNTLQDQDNSDYIRRAALEALVLLPVEESRFNDLLLDLLDVQSIGLLWHVIEQVGKRRVKQAVDKLEAYTKHPDPIVVGDSVWALRELYEHKMIDLSPQQSEDLINCLTSEDLHVQGHALRTIGRLRLASAIPKLKKHLSQKNTGYRWIVPEAAQLIGGDKAVELLDLALDDQDPRVIAAGLLGVSGIVEKIPEQTLNKIKLHMENHIWIPFLEQPISSIARSTYQKLINKDSFERLPRIYLTRHCKTKWNLERRLQGTMDLPLSNEGRAEAKELLPAIEVLGIERIISSPYKRAYETAKIFADHLNVPIHINHGFRELNHGVWEGKTLEELSKTTQYSEWLEDATSVIIPDSSESISMAQQRAIEALRDIALKYNNETLLIVTHKHIRAILQCGLQEIDLRFFGNQISESIQPQEIPIEQIIRLCKVTYL